MAFKLPKYLVPGYSTSKKPTIPVEIDRGDSIGRDITFACIGLSDAVSGKISEHSGITFNQGNAVFNSSSDLISFGDASGTTGLSKCTYISIIIPSGTGDGGIFSKRDSSNSSWQMWRYEGNHHFRVYTGGGAQRTVQTGTLSTDKYIACMTHDSTILEGFVDGVSLGTASAPGAVDDSDASLWVGKSYSDAFTFSGEVVLSAVCKRILTANEMLALFREPYKILKPAIDQYIAFDASGTGGTSTEIPSNNLELTSYAPTISVSSNISIEVPKQDLNLTTYTPLITATDHKTVAIPGHNLDITSYTPSISVSDHVSVDVPVHNLAITSYVPVFLASDHKNIEAGKHDLSLQSYSPTATATDHKTVSIGNHNLSIQSYEPTVTVGDAVEINIPAHNINLTSYEPTVLANVSVIAQKHDINITSYAPTINTGANVVIEPGKHDLSLTSYTPEIAATDNIEVIIPAHDLSLQSYPPSIVISSFYSGIIPKTNINLTSYAPIISSGIVTTIHPGRVYTVEAESNIYTVEPENRTYTRT